MKAIAAPGYGPLERLAEIEMPLPDPGAGEARTAMLEFRSDVVASGGGG